MPIGVGPGTGSLALMRGDSALLDGAIRPTPSFENGQLWGVAFFPGRNRIKFNSYGFKPGDVIEMRMPGGAGFGPVAEREQAQILHDLAMGYITLHHAQEDYGLV